MIRRPQIHMIGGGRLCWTAGLSLVIRRPSHDRRRWFISMLDRRMENARVNTYFFRILLSADRGTISAEIMAELEARGFCIISACLSAPTSWCAS
jgi:hypothetical protein